MLQGHVFHSFTGKPWREGSLYQLSQFLGGMPPAIFLFLTGITMGFLMDSVEKKGHGAGERVYQALRRSSYLFVLAYAFRFQMWLFAWPASPWTDLFRVDILNAMGLGLSALSLTAFFSTAKRVRLCAVLGILIAAISPLVSQLDWSGAPNLLKNYLVPDSNYFSFFPWASYLAFGVAAGSLLRVSNDEAIERTMQWGALSGFALILGGQYFGGIPYSIYPKSEFWLDSPALVLIKLGAILLMLSTAYVWNAYVVRDQWSWIRTLGMASLPVYWIHTELVYGRWLWFWKEDLGPPQTALVAALVIALMLVVALGRQRWPRTA